MKRTAILIFLIALGGAAFGQTITVTSPVGGETWLLGSHHDITWTFNGCPANTRVKLQLYRNGTKLGVIIDDISIGNSGAGKFDWITGSYAGLTAEAGDGYKVRIRDMNNAYPFSESPQPFSISQTQSQHPVFANIKAKYEPPAVHSTGTVLIHKNLVCDLDSGHETSAPGCDDFWWMQNSNPPYQRLFIPCEGAFFKALGVWADSSFAAVHNVSFPSPQNPIPDADLPIGMVVAYQTNFGRRGAFRVVAKGDNGSLTIAWITYEN
jgi:hypothetical protein